MSSRPNEPLPHAFALRLGLWYAGLFIVSAALLSVFTYALLGRALANQDHDVLESTLSRYSLEYQRAGLAGLRTLIDADAGEGLHERLLIRVVDDRTESIYFTTPPGWSAFSPATLDQVAAQRSIWTTLTNPEDRTVLELGTAHLSNGVIIQVGRTSHLRDQVLQNFRARSLEVFAITGLIAIVGGVLLTSAGLSPLRALDATLRSILQTGRFDARVETRGTRDPLDVLGGLVNDMLSRIQTLVGGMRGALDNVAHDLRTPLTRFRNVAEAALVKEDPVAMKEALAKALDEANRVNATLTALMDISEAESGTMTLNRERVHLAEVAEEALSLYADEAEDKGLAIHVAIDPAIELQADRTRLRQILANLIENAIKYTDAGGRIDIEGVESAPARAVIASVRDTGIGISAEHLPLVWDRLYRVEASRSTRGLGLGLSLVKAVVEAHGGRVGVSSSPGNGSTFTVTLPRTAGAD
jgi:signal transduction histidine kinase